MLTLSLALLGGFQVSIDAEPVAGYRSAKAQALLAYLAVEQARARSRDELLGLLWPDYTQEAAATNLRQSLSRLQKAIHNDAAKPPYLLISRESVQFNPACNHTLDVIRFNDLLSACPHHDASPDPRCARCAENRKAAVALYQGDFLAHFSCDSPEFDTWAATLRTELHQKALSALHYLAIYAEQRGEQTIAQEYANRQLALEPWREEAHLQLIRLLARQGETSAALAQYERCCRVLQAELGVEPSPALQTLYAEIRDSSGQRSESVQPNNLPPLSTSFLGRTEELAQIRQYLVDAERRLLSLVGPGGVGKTRLALQIAHSVVGERRGLFRDGVYFVSLSGVSTGSYLVSALANALGLTFTGAADPEQQVLAHLHNRQLLLVLDNFEHLVANAAPILSAILQAAPGVRLLVTSRERLNLAEEWVLALNGLPFPVLPGTSQPGHQLPSVIPADQLMEDYGAVHLFVERARQTDAQFDPRANPGQSAAIIRICGLLEGIPLGIEMAAAWVHMLSCAEIADEIARNLDFLTTPQRNAPLRHRSLRAVFEHSWNLLTLQEQDVLAALSVFQGGFTREAAASIADASLLPLRSLVDKSLLKFTMGRYELHELLRQFAAVKLRTDAEEEEAVHERHAQYYGDYLRQLEPLWHGAQEQVAIIQVKNELRNIQAGWQWSVVHQRPAILERYIPSTGYGFLSYFTMVGWLREGKSIFEFARTHLTTALQQNIQPKAMIYPTLAKVMVSEALFDRLLGQPDRALKSLHDSLAILYDYPDENTTSRAYHMLGLIAYDQGDYKTSYRYLHQSYESHAHNDSSRKASLCVHLGQVELALDNYHRAKDWCQAGLEIYQELGKSWGIANALLNLARIAELLDEDEQAERLCEQSLDLFTQLDNQTGIALCNNHLGVLAQKRADYALASVKHQQSMAVYQENGEKMGLIRTANHLCDIACAQGDETMARSYLRTSFDLAMNMKATPLLLYTLLGAVKLLFTRYSSVLGGLSELENDSATPPLKAIFTLLSLVARHPASDYKARHQAQSLLSDLASQLSATLVDQLQEQIQSQSLGGSVMHLFTHELSDISYLNEAILFLESMSIINLNVTEQKRSSSNGR
jgi:predicted ATPase/DNA-binding SARP family transcriptional activator